MKSFQQGLNKGLNTNNWFLPALFLIFMTLKLTNTITWSWWWVTAPIWGPVFIALVLFLIVTPWTLFGERK
jgi:hypothetical protein